MTQCQAARLDDRAVIAITGEGAAPFLAGLATVELSHLAPDAARHGALLTPQGKILFDFGVHEGPGGVLLDVAAPAHDELAKRLTFYRLRLKLEIAPRDDLAVFAAWGRCDGGALPADSRLAALGRRGIAPADTPLADLAPDAEAADAQAYHRHRIACGVAECASDFQPNEVFPHEANLDGLHAVDFDKGCYVGQEVVSRMHHRGTAKKRFLIVEGKQDLPAAGTEIRDGTLLVGTMGSADGRQGLALLRLDRAADAIAAGRGIEAGGVALQPRLQDWASFSLTQTPLENEG